MALKDVLIEVIAKAREDVAREAQEARELNERWLVRREAILQLFREAESALIESKLRSDSGLSNGVAVHLDAGPPSGFQHRLVYSWSAEKRAVLRESTIGSEPERFDLERLTDEVVTEHIKHFVRVVARGDGIKPPSAGSVSLPFGY